MDLADSGQKPKAIAKLKKIYSKYKGLPPGKAAKDELEELGVNTKKIKSSGKNNSPKKAKPDRVDDADIDEKEAQERLEKARKFEADGKLYEAYNRYKYLKMKYPHTEAGKKAVKDYKRLGADKKFKKELKTRLAKKKCASWLKLAEKFIEDEQYADAADFLDKIIDRFPGTKYAKQAKKRLKEIKDK